MRIALQKCDAQPGRRASWCGSASVRQGPQVVHDSAQWRVLGGILLVASWVGLVGQSLAVEKARVVYDKTSLKAVETIIVAPEKHLVLAGRVAEAIQAATGEKLAIKLDTKVEAEDWRKYNMLLLGSMCNNKAILRVYAEHRCAVDAIYPGKDGYVVQTTDDPLGHHKNVIVIGGSDNDGVSTAANQFIAALKDPKLLDQMGKTIDRLFLVKTDIRKSVPNHTPIFLYYMTGDNDLRDTFLKRGWSPPSQRERNFRGWTFSLPWYYLDYGPGMSEAQRTSATKQLIVSLDQYGAEFFTEKGGFRADPDSPGRLLHNYDVNPSYSAWLVAHYADKYFNNNKGTWPHLMRIEAYLDQQLFCYRNNDDCVGYHSWMTALKLLDYYAMSGKMDRFVENGQMRLFGDYVVATVDNLGMDLCTGEQTSYGSRGLMWSQALRMAATYAPNGGEYNWFFDYCKQFKYQGAGEISYEQNLFAGHGHDPLGLYFTDRPPIKPTRLLGTFALGLGRFHPSICKKQGDIPPEQFFDKLTFRRDFSRDDEYLCLEGPETGYLHGENDSNSVLRLTWNDRTWLCAQTIGYDNNNRTETQWRSAAWPGREQSRNARLIAAGNFDQTGLTTTRTEYAQATWNRHVFWDKGDVFFFVDDLVAKKPGALAGTCRWESLGQITFDAERGIFTAEQNGPKFFIIGDDGAARSLTVQKRNGSKGEPIHYGPRRELGAFPTFGAPNLDPSDPWPKVLLENQQREMKTGEVMRFSNLMWSVKAGEQRRYGVKKLDDGCFVISDGASPILVGVNNTRHHERGSLKIEAGSFLIKDKYLAATQCTSITIDGQQILKSTVPVEVEIDWNEKQGRLSMMPAGKQASVTFTGKISAAGKSSIDLRPEQPCPLTVAGVAPAGLAKLLAELPRVEPIK